MTAITSLRSAIAAALDNPGVWSVYSFPPTSPTANSVEIHADDPYLEPTNNAWESIAPLANFRIRAIVPLFDNQGNLAGIESFLVDVFKKLSESNLVFRFGNFTAPSTLPVDQGQMLASELSISILTSWS